MEANGLSSDLIQIEALRERGRRLVVQTRLRALPVVEDLDVFTDRAPCLLARGEALMIDQFVLQRSPEGFDRGVVVAIAAAAHRRQHVELAHERLIGQRTILRPAIGVVNQTRRRSPGRDRAKQGLHDQMFRHPFAHPRALEAFDRYVEWRYRVVTECHWTGMSIAA